MKCKFLVTLFSLPILISSAYAQQGQESMKIYPNPARDSVAQVAPALVTYNLKYVHEGLWQRPDLSIRDRCLITIATLIARNDVTELAVYVEMALDNGIKPSEISELVTHLNFYAGRPNAYSAAVAIEPIFKKRGITAQDLPVYNVTLMPIDQAAEDARAKQVAANFSTVSSGVVKYTTDTLFNDLWLRPGLQPRDRSLITICALVTSGNVEHIPYHLNRAMDNGLTKAEASEVLTQLAFYAGWPNTFSAMPFFKTVFESRNLN